MNFASSFIIRYGFILSLYLVLSIVLWRAKKKQNYHQIIFSQEQLLAIRDHVGIAVVEWWEEHFSNRIFRYPAWFRILFSREEIALAWRRICSNFAGSIFISVYLSLPFWILSRPLGFLIMIPGPVYSLQEWTKLRKIALTQRKEIEEEFPIMVLRLLMALKAGVLLQKSWEEICHQTQGALYEEMRRVLTLQKSGVSRKETFGVFCRKYEWDPIRNFILLLQQSLDSGDVELIYGLAQLRKELFEQKRRTLQLEAELASQKMLLPSLLLFVAILILALVPLLESSIMGL